MMDQARTLTNRILAEERVRKAPLILLLATILLIENNKEDLVAKKQGREKARKTEREQMESFHVQVTSFQRKRSVPG
jgi:hypothetical protein